jgi:hypothetical protein
MTAALTASENNRRAQQASLFGAAGGCRTGMRTAVALKATVGARATHQQASTHERLYLVSCCAVALQELLLLLQMQ